MRAMGLGIVSLVTLVLVGSSWSGASQAQAPAVQQAPPLRIQVSVTQIKPDLILAWEDLVKNEMIPAQRKANIPWRHTFGSGVMSPQFVRITVTPVPNFAEFDKPGPLIRTVNEAAQANYNAKTRPAIDSIRTSVMTLRQDLSIISGATTMQPLVLVQTLRLLPGRGAAFTASMVEDYLPAYRKGGLKDYWVYATNFGGPGGEFTFVTPLPNYAELDRPAYLTRAGMSPDAINKFNARRNLLLADGIVNEVYRFIPALSYGMPPAPPATN